MVSETLTNTAKSTLSSPFISLSPPWFWGDGRRKAGGKRTTDFSSLSLLNSLLVCLCLSPAVAISKRLPWGRICAKTQFFRRLTVHRSWRRLVLGQMRSLCIESWCSTWWALVDLQTSFLRVTSFSVPWASVQEAQPTLLPMPWMGLFHFLPSLFWHPWKLVFSDNKLLRAKSASPQSSHVLLLPSSSLKFVCVYFITDQNKLYLFLVYNWMF